MKKKFYLLGLLLLFALLPATKVFSQFNSYESSFEEADTLVTWTCWANGFQFDIGNGELTVDYNLTDEPDNRWDRFVLWLESFDFSVNPYISFTVKAEEDLNCSITLRDPDNGTNEIPFQLAGDNEYKTFTFDLSEYASAVDLTNIREIQFDIGFKVLSGKLYFNNIKLGAAARDSEVDGDSFETSFDNPETSGTWVCWANGFQFNVEGGEMKVTYDLNDDAGNVWDRMVFWVDPFNFTKNPYMSFTIKSDAERNSSITVKNRAGQSFDVSFVIPGDGEYKTFFFDISEYQSAIDLSEVQELQIDIGSKEMSGTLYFDEVKLGAAAAPAATEPESDSFVTYFDDPATSGTWNCWANGYQFDVANGVMTVTYNLSEAAGNNWDRMVFWLEEFNFSNNPYISFTMKSDAARNSSITVKDPFGGAADITFQLEGNNEFKTFFFDISDYASAVNLSKVNEIQFDIGSSDMTGTLIFDDVKLGAAAKPEDDTSTKVPLTKINDELIFYPNPAKNVITFSSNIKSNSVVEIYDLSGRKLYSEKIISNNQIQVSSLQPGLYIIKAETPEGQKLVSKMQKL